MTICAVFLQNGLMQMFKECDWRQEDIETAVGRVKVLRCLPSDPGPRGNPPPLGSGLQNTPLILYSLTYVYGVENHPLDNYHHSDEWSGTAWITAGKKSAVIFVGTKGFGDCWYGNPDGPCLDCEDRFNVASIQQKSHVNAACFNRKDGLLYIFENRADGDKPIIHVWEVISDSDSIPRKKKKSTIRR